MRPLCKGQSSDSEAGVKESQKTSHAAGGAEARSPWQTPKQGKKVGARAQRLCAGQDTERWKVEG